MRKIRVMVCLMVVYVCLILFGCSSKQPSEDQIKEDIISSQKEIFNDTIRFDVDVTGFNGSYIAMRDPELISFELAKSQTKEDSYKAWYEAVLEDETYRDACTVVVEYAKYDGNHWELESAYIEAGSLKSECKSALPDVTIITLLESTGDGSITVEAVMDKSMEEKDVCQAGLFLKHGDGIKPTMMDGAYHVSLAGTNTSIFVQAKISLTYNGDHVWFVNYLDTEDPDINNLVSYNSDAILEFAKFFLNGAKNLDSLQLENYVNLNDGKYYFRYGGTDGYVELYMRYLKNEMLLEYNSVNLHNWNYKYSGNDDGPLFFDPYPNNGF